MNTPLNCQHERNLRDANADTPLLFVLPLNGGGNRLDHCQSPLLQNCTAKPLVKESSAPALAVALAKTTIPCTFHTFPRRAQSEIAARSPTVSANRMSSPTSSNSSFKASFKKELHICNTSRINHIHRSHQYRNRTTIISRPLCGPLKQVMRRS
jgi:hypothetical protein